MTKETYMRSMERFKDIKGENITLSNGIKFQLKGFAAEWDLNSPDPGYYNEKIRNIKNYADLMKHNSKIMFAIKKEQFKE